MLLLPLQFCMVGGEQCWAEHGSDCRILLCALRATPWLQVWLGRAAMGLFALLLAYESVHSNRPAFSTLFYLWF